MGIEESNRLEYTGDGHYIFDLTLEGWVLCVEGELDMPEHMFLSGGWVPKDDPITAMFADVISDSIESSLNWSDGYELDKEVREMVLNAPVHEEVDNS